MLRVYKFAANRPCEECDPQHTPVGEPPGLDKLDDRLSGRHTLGVEDGRKEMEEIGVWVQRLSE